MCADLCSQDHSTVPRVPRGLFASSSICLDPPGIAGAPTLLRRHWFSPERPALGVHPRLRFIVQIRELKVHRHLNLDFGSMEREDSIPAMALGVSSWPKRASRICLS